MTRFPLLIFLTNSWLQKFRLQISTASLSWSGRQQSRGFNGGSISDIEALERSIRLAVEDAEREAGERIDDLKLSNIDEAKQISEKLLNNEIEITDNDKTKRKIPVKPPFITSTLQQTSSAMLGFSLAKTMKLAQDLYAAGYISNMRTDSPNLSILPQNNCKQYLLEKFGDTYS